MNTIFAATHARPQAAAHTIFDYLPKLFLVMLIAMLAACSSVVPRGGNVPVTSTKPAAKPVTKIIANYGTQHRIALLLPITGPDADVGQSIANATAMALADTKNVSIRLTTYDTALGVSAATQNAISDGNVLILGPFRGDNVIEVANLARPAAVPVISFSNDVGVAAPDIFLMGHLPNQSIDRVVRYAKANGLSRFGGIVPKSVYGQRALSNLTRSVRDAGGILVSIQESDGSSASIDAAARKLGASGAVDAVLIADNANMAMASIPYIRSNGMKTARILGTDQWNVSNTLSSNTAARGAWFASVSDGFYRQYADKYKARYKKPPFRLSSLGYDAVLLVSRVAQNWTMATPFPTERMTDSGGFIGIDGAFRFLPNGLSERMLEVQEVQASRFMTVEPAPKAFTP